MAEITTNPLNTQLVYGYLKFIFLHLMEKYEMKSLVKSVFQKYPQKVMLWHVQWFSGEKIDFWSKNRCFSFFRPHFRNLEQKLGNLKKNLPILTLIWPILKISPTFTPKIFKIGQIKVEMGKFFFSKYLIFTQDSEYEVAKFKKTYFSSQKSIFSI